MSWFEVDRDGLRQLLEGKDKAFVLRELVQNAWDEPGVTRCDVTLEPIPGRPAARLVVEGGGHVDEGYYRCLCEIGAKLALTEPGVVLGE